MSHPFGDLLRQYRARKASLSQTRLAELTGYDPAVLVRMSQGKKDLTGPSGRERIVRIIAVLHEEGALMTHAEANALLKSAGMAPLYEGQPAESELLKLLHVDGIALTYPLLAQAKPVPHLSNLPVQLTSFVGRERELAEVRRLLGTTRLLTLTGSGGCGKTRLALEVGQADMERFLDGVWLVELASLSSPELVADTVGSAFGLRPMSQSALTMLLDHLRDRVTLLVLDNCEHLILACAELAGALLRVCPELHILATSREALGVLGEVTWRVPSLTLQEAIHLFEERGRAARPGFAVTSANADAVERICRRLDAMPLALELAAARLRAFSPGQIAARLDDAFRMLSSDNRTALPRQQTLRGTIDWSYNLLAEDEQALLHELSVFAGDWSLEAAEAIHGADTPILLEQLVSKTLVNANGGDGADDLRYSLLETIRQYAHERLIEAGTHDPVHQRHLAYFAGLAQAAKPHLHGPAQIMWMDRLELEIDNLRTALEWAKGTQDVQNGERLIDGLWWMWSQRGYFQEGRKWIEIVLPIDRTGVSSARALADIAAADLAMRLGLFELAYAELTRALPVAHQLRDARLTIMADLGLAKAHPTDGQATAWLEEAARLAHEGGLRWEELHALSTLSYHMWWEDNVRQAARLATEALTGFRSLGDTTMCTDMLVTLGTMAVLEGDYAKARPALVESVALARAARLSIQVADSLIALAIVNYHEGVYAQALVEVEEAIALFDKFGNVERVGQCLTVAAGIAYARDDLRRAAILLGAVDQMWDTYGAQRYPYMTIVFDKCLPAVKAALDAATFERAWSEGRQLTVKDAIAEALAI